MVRPLHPMCSSGCWSASTKTTVFSLRSLLVDQEKTRLVDGYFVHSRDVKYCNECNCLSVCPSVCLSTCISEKPHVQTSRHFLYTLIVVTDRSSSDITAMLKRLLLLHLNNSAIRIYSKKQQILYLVFSLLLFLLGSTRRVHFLVTLQLLR